MIDHYSEQRVSRASRLLRAGSSHSRELGDLAGDLATDLDRGLAESTARLRLGEVGINRLPVPDRPPDAAIAARQMADPLVALLVAATAVSFLIGEQLEALVIAAIVVLNAARAVWGDVRVSAVVSLALLVSASVATLIAMSLPYALQQLGRDPAFGSGPLATVIQDLLSVAAYFAIAAALL